MKKNSIAAPLVILIVLLLIYAPILILAFYSFTDASSIGESAHFSIDNYITLFTTEELAEMIRGTLFLALGVAILSTILGTLGAMGSFYSKPGTLAAYRVINQIPVINADVVTGFSVCILLVVVFGIIKREFIDISPPCCRA